MSLKEKLQKIAEASAKQIPEDSQKIMHAATDAVAASIGTRKIPQAGDVLPAFDLLDSNGNNTVAADIAEQGPFVLSFFRGKW